MTSDSIVFIVCLCCFICLTGAVSIADDMSDYKAEAVGWIETNRPMLEEAALHGIRPGMTGREADALARQVIEEAGYGDRFGHGLGHGIGLESGHDKPALSQRYEGGKDPLRTGMVFTVEPGIYLPGEFGVRIEDDVILREDGVQVLSKAAKEPFVQT